MFRKIHWRDFAVSLALMTVGWLFYIFCRGYDPAGMFYSHPNLKGLPAIFQHSFPSFIHALSCLFLFRLLFVRRRNFWLAWSLSTAGYEILQAISPTLGTFDFKDLAATGLAAAFFPLTSKVGEVPDWMKRLLLLGSVAASVATSGPREKLKATHVPVCQSKDEFRASFAVKEPREPKVSGKISAFGNYLFLSEPFEGVHIYDNSDPSSPVALMFLQIPGNTDLALREGFLYADSAVDLLTIELKSGEVQLVHRNEDVLDARTPAEFENDHVYVDPEVIEKCKVSGGVVVGYKKYEEGSAYKSRIEENKK